MVITIPNAQARGVTFLGVTISILPGDLVTGPQPTTIICMLRRFWWTFGLTTISRAAAEVSRVYRWDCVPRLCPAPAARHAPAIISRLPPRGFRRHQDTEPSSVFVINLVFVSPHRQQSARAPALWEPIICSVLFCKWNITLFIKRSRERCRLQNLPIVKLHGAIKHIE